MSKSAFRHKKIRSTKGCAVLFGFQRTGGGYRESPLTFHAEKLRGLQPSFLIFFKIFELCSDFCRRHKERAPEIAAFRKGTCCQARFQENRRWRNDPSPPIVFRLFRFRKRRLIQPRISFSFCRLRPAESERRR